MGHADLAAGVWRIERSRLVGVAARLLRDLDEAEDCAQDALLAALGAWPRDGLPANPAAWLMTATRNKALDLLRRRAMLQREHEALAADDAAAGAHIEPDFVDRLDAARDQAAIGDELLRLIFIACHPVLPREAQVALTLRLLGGLETADIARAFLVPEATVAQRIVRAKKALRGQAFELPAADERAARLGGVLAVVYLIFNEGHSAGSGAQLLRPALCDEALRLARQLQHLLPDEPEAHGLAALLEIQASRLPARLDARGRPVLLPEQDRRRWDRLLIQRGPGGPGARRGAGRAWSLHAAGRGRRLPCACGACGRHRLGRHRRRLRPPAGAQPLAGGGAEPRGGDQPRARAGSRLAAAAGAG